VRKGGRGVGVVSVQKLIKIKMSTAGRMQGNRRERKR
jgi:hypothetical protein